MELSQLDLDRNINRLRIHSVEYSELSDEELISLLEKTLLPHLLQMFISISLANVPPNSNKSFVPSPFGEKAFGK